jgi:hypothetical protein
MTSEAMRTELSDSECSELRALVERIGENCAIEILNISRETLARSLAGLSVRRGTVALIRAGLAANIGHSLT